MSHTSASVFCRTFHIEAASVDKCLLPFCSPVFVLLIGTEIGFCLSYYEMEVYTVLQEGQKPHP